VMTVHGAKGLEAPIVILADTTTRPTGPRDPRLYRLPRKGPPGTPDCLVWAATMITDVGPIGPARMLARRDAEDEYRRLLYVAMTRAADRLIVCGAQGLNGKPPGCWYDLVADALWDTAVEEPADHGDGAVRRWQLPGTSAVPATIAQAPAAIAPEGALPAWLTRAAADESLAARVVAPSAVLDTAPYGRFGGEADREALARGRIVHRLLQALPEIAPERRAEAADRHLARVGQAFTPDARAAILAEVLAVLDDPAFAPLWATGSRAEVPIVGRLVRDRAPPLVVSGQVDRLAVTVEAVLIADYKTNRPAPRRLEDVPRSYVAQLALYRAVLQKLYPGREVRAALVWTDIPDLLAVPNTALEAALMTLA